MMTFVSNCSTEEFEETNIPTNHPIVIPTVIPTEAVEGPYIGNKKSRKFHKTDCDTLPAEKNRVYLSSREEARGRGFSPCGNCLP